MKRKSSKVHFLYNPISQITMASGDFTIYTANNLLCHEILEWHKKNTPKKPFNGEKWKKPHEEQQRGEPSPRMDGHTIDVVHTEQTKIAKLHNGKQDDKNYK